MSISQEDLKMAGGIHLTVPLKYTATSSSWSLICSSALVNEISIKVNDFFFLKPLHGNLKLPIHSKF